LNIEGVDLYGEKRQSTVRALRKHYSSEQIKEAVMSKTNKAFERYLGHAEDDAILSIYRKGAEVIPINEIDTVLIPLLEFLWTFLDFVLVEAAGIEPASENLPLELLRA